MGELIVLYRSGIVVLSGTIISIDKDEQSIIIENYCSVVNEIRRCKIHVHKNETARPDMTVGSFILATVKSNQPLAILATGGNDGVHFYESDGYNIRYSGAYDFAPRGIEKEQHVFLGSPLSSYQGRSGTWYTIGWTKNQKRETRVLYADRATAERINDYLSDGSSSRLVYITGEKKLSERGSYYVINQVVD